MAASRNAGRKRITFACKANPGDRVFVAGSFNGWDPAAHELRDSAGDGLYTRTMYLEAGRHEYKYVINGEWCIDPQCPEWVPNPLGSLNNVRVLG